jgi:hypothetical protein
MHPKPGMSAVMVLRILSVMASRIGSLSFEQRWDATNIVYIDTLKVVMSAQKQSKSKGFSATPKLLRAANARTAESFRPNLICS